VAKRNLIFYDRRAMSRLRAFFKSTPESNRRVTSDKLYSR
jgi:hypothetical protein